MEDSKWTSWRVYPFGQLPWHLLSFPSSSADTAAFSTMHPFKETHCRRRPIGSQTDNRSVCTAGQIESSRCTSKRLLEPTGSERPPILAGLVAET